MVNKKSLLALVTAFLIVFSAPFAIAACDDDHVHSHILSYELEECEDMAKILAEIDRIINHPDAVVTLIAGKSPALTLAAQTRTLNNQFESATSALDANILIFTTTYEVQNISARSFPQPDRCPPGQHKSVRVTSITPLEPFHTDVSHGWCLFGEVVTWVCNVCTTSGVDTSRWLAPCRG